MDIPNVLEDVEAMISQDRTASPPPSAASRDNDDNNIISSGSKDFDTIHAGVVCSDSVDCDDDSSGNKDDDNKDNSENNSTCRNQLLLGEQIEFLHEKQALLQRASHELALEEIFDASNAQALVREAAVKRSSSSSNNNSSSSRDGPTTTGDDRTGIWEEARSFLASLEASSCGFSKDPSTESLPVPTMKYSSSSAKRIGGEKIGSPADPSIDITTVERMSSEQYDLLLMPLSSEGGEDWQRSLPVTG